MATRDPRADQALALLRVVVGIVFLAHGWQKFFIMGIPGVTGFFTQIGAPFPALAAPFVATLELAGGAAIIAGLFARPIALLLVCDMLGSIVLVHVKNGFFVPGGIEFVMTLAAGAAAIAVGGAGTMSADRALAARKSREWLS